jgi:hypothetical protein
VILHVVPDTLRVPASPVWTMTMRSEAQRKPCCNRFRPTSLKPPVPTGMCGVVCAQCALYVIVSFGERESMLVCVNCVFAQRNVAMAAAADILIASTSAVMLASGECVCSADVLQS